METLISTQFHTALYHQALLLVSLAGLALAAITRPAAHPAGAPGTGYPAHLLGGFAGVFVLRLATAVVPFNAVPAQPAERITDMGCLALLTWMAVPAFHRHKCIAAAWLALHGVLIAAYLGITVTADATIVAPRLHYNLIPLAHLWAVWLVVTVVAAIVGLAMADGSPTLDGRPETRSLVLLALGTLLIGYDFHLLALANVLPPYPPPDNVAAWVRCAQLIAYPVLVGAFFSASQPSKEQHNKP